MDKDTFNKLQYFIETTQLKLKLHNCISYEKRMKTLRYTGMRVNFLKFTVNQLRKYVYTTFNLIQ